MILAGRPGGIYFTEDAAPAAAMLAQRLCQSLQSFDIVRTGNRSARNIGHGKWDPGKSAGEYLRTRAKCITIIECKPVYTPSSGGLDFSPTKSLQRMAKGMAGHQRIPGSLVLALSKLHRMFGLGTHP